MSIDTKAILRKGTTIEQIEKAISEKYTVVKVQPTMTDFMFVTFKDGTDRRQLSVSFANSCEKEYGIAGVWISLGMWGNGVEIAKYLCETFGGYLDENDCDDKGFYPINFELYSQGTEFTELDKFRHKVIEEVGYDKLNTVIGLFNSFTKKILVAEIKKKSKFTEDDSYVKKTLLSFDKKSLENKIENHFQIKLEKESKYDFPYFTDGGFKYDTENENFFFEIEAHWHEVV